MILSKEGIIKAIEQGEIRISRHDKPFNPETQISANSIDLTLSKWIYRIHKHAVYVDALTGQFRYLIDDDIYAPELIEIPEKGYRLSNDYVYLACTNEKIWSNTFVPECKDKSSLGRMFCPTHFNAGLGDLGFDGYYTLEIAPQIDIKVYAGMAICQIKFHKASDSGEPYKETGRYMNNEPIPVPSKGVKLI